MRYEDLVDDDVYTLQTLFRTIGVEVEGDVVEEATDLFCFENLSGGRERGQEDSSSHFRKGQSKDWENWFDDRHLTLFKDAGGFDALQQVGYNISDKERV